MDEYDGIINNIPTIASTPHVDNLCRVSCEINIAEVQDSSAKSNFHWQTMKCRLLIYHMTEVIAAPAPTVTKPLPFFPQCKYEEEPLYINVICTKEFFETGILQNYCKRYNLAYGSLLLVTIEIYKSCLSYTVQCKIAPEWIRIGQNLLRDVNFYDSTNDVEVIQLNINIEDSSGDCGIERTRFDFVARKAKIPFLSLEDFYFPPPLSAEFNADPEGRVDFTLPYYSQFSRWIHVLPSMKRGKIVSLSKEIPKSCPFKDYEQLRRHWRNMYGYRLPETSENILYYEVCFPVPSMKNIRFTYPSCCLVIKPLEFHIYKDPSQLIAKFIQHLLKHVPKICDTRLEISKYIPPPKTPSADNASGLKIKNVERVSLPSHWLTIMGSTPSSQEMTPKMEFSAKYPNPLLKTTAPAREPRLTPCLAMIQQFHNASGVQTNNGGELGNKSFVNSSMSMKSTGNENISNYFKERKLRLKPYDKPLHTMSLKEKILSNMSAKTDGMNDQSVEKMAKEGKLNSLTNDRLKHWLRERSIPYTTHDRKRELIQKITYHMDNTRLLPQSINSKDV